jgi:hypothetical protein
MTVLGLAASTRDTVRVDLLCFKEFGSIHFAKLPQKAGRPSPNVELWSDNRCLNQERLVLRSWE